MKIFALLLLPALLVGSFAHAADTSSALHPLRPVSQCPDITKINEWHIINAKTLTVRTGPHRFVIKTQYACPRLGRYGSGLNFRPSNGTQAVGESRICGDLGDQVSSRAQPPCQVQSVREISKQRFDALNKKAVRNGSGAEQPTATPNPRH